MVDNWSVIRLVLHAGGGVGRRVSRYRVYGEIEGVEVEVEVGELGVFGELSE